MFSCVAQRRVFDIQPVPSFAILASSGMQIQDLVDQYEEVNKILDSIAG